MNERALLREVTVLCRACAGEAYYRVVSRDSDCAVPVARAEAVVPS